MPSWIRGSSPVGDSDTLGKNQSRLSPWALSAISCSAPLRSAPLPDLMRSQLVAAAVGVSPERGDTVVVQGVAPPAPATPQAAPPPRAAAAAATAPDPFALWPFAVAALAIVAASLVGWWAHRRGRKADRAPVLDLRQRELVLQRVQGWMLQAQAAPGAAASASSRQEAP